MTFEDDEGKAVEISFENFEKILPGGKPGFTVVRLKDGQEVCVQATENQVLEATAEE